MKRFKYLLLVIAFEKADIIASMYAYALKKKAYVDRL